jgi:hypothetical protein
MLKVLGTYSLDVCSCFNLAKAASHWPSPHWPWQGGGGLIAIDSPTAGNQATDATHGVLATYGNPIGMVPGNYVQADGNPDYEGSFSYTVTGLTVGQTYSLSFYQGASSQVNFGFNSVTGQDSGTTNRWIVSLGTDPLTVSKTGGPVDPEFGQTGTYYNTDPNASVVASPLMTVPYQGTVGWDYVTVNLTADATSDLLSFLAWGDNGSTVNLPPIAFLAGVNSPAGLGVDAPEPASLSLVALGVAGLYRAKRRKHAI